MSLSLSKNFFLILLFFQTTSHAVYFGLNEGLMGNTGVAISDSKAASLYNPSLLRNKGERSFSIGGTNLNRYSSSDKNGSNVKGVNFSPSYLSTVLPGESVTQEIYILNQFSGRFSYLGRSSELDSSNIVLDGEVDLSIIESGYSLAFNSIPFALQAGLKYSSVNNRLNSQFATDSEEGVIVINTKEENIEAFFGVSHHFKLGGYTFGVNGRLPNLKIKENSKQVQDTYLYANNNFSKIRTESKTNNYQQTGAKILIGHGFVVGDHEFLTDTLLNQESVYNNKYSINQTFGYKLKINNKFKFLTGISKNVKTVAENLKEDINISTGFTSTKSTYETAFGFGYNKSSVDGSESETVSLIFSSEFSY